MCGVRGAVAWFDNACIQLMFRKERRQKQMAMVQSGFQAKDCERSTDKDQARYRALTRIRIDGCQNHRNNRHSRAALLLNMLLF
jgi:hypothetical protein